MKIPERSALVQVPRIGNFIYIIKPADTEIIEGKVLSEPPSLEMLQFGVEGDITLIPRFDSFGGRPCAAFCNEYGIMLNLRPNHLAQMCWEQCVGQFITTDQLLGNVVVIAADPAFLGEM